MDRTIEVSSPISCANSPFPSNIGQKVSSSFSSSSPSERDSLFGHSNSSSDEGEIQNILDGLDVSDQKKRVLQLDGNSLTIEDLVDCSNDLCVIRVCFLNHTYAFVKCQIKLTESSKENIRKSRQFLEVLFNASIST